MRKLLRFQKPQPLSPKSKTWVEGNTRYQKNKNARGGKTSVKGVPTTDSIYYLWFEYLKRSEKYKKACANNGKGMAKLYKDFGNIFQYRTNAMGYTDVNDFYSKWWEKRGAELFGIQDTENELREFASYEDVVSLKSDIDNYEILLLPKVMPKTEMRKRVGKLITSIKEDADRGKAKYEVVSERVDVESLRNCLEVYDLMTDKNNKLTAVEVYAEVIGIKAEHKDLDLFTDARSERGMLRDWRVGLLKGKKADDEMLIGKAYTYAKQKVQWRTKQRVKGQNEDIWVDTRKLTKDELEQLELIYYGKYLGILEKTPQSEERVKAKNYYKMATYRLINKAKANIKAVEKGMFGEGH